MAYRSEEREVYRDANGVPVERRTVREERALPEEPVVAYGQPVPVERPVVRDQYVETAYVPPAVAAAPVQDEVVSDRVVQDEAVNRWSTLDLATRIIWFLTGLLLIGLAARFIFKATGANTGSSFVAFVYNSTAAFVAPFRGIFTDSVSGNSVLEVSTIVAIVVWALIAYLLTWLLGILLGGPSRGVREYRRDVRRF